MSGVRAKRCSDLQEQDACKVDTRTMMDEVEKSRSYQNRTVRETKWQNAQVSEFLHLLGAYRVQVKVELDEKEVKRKMSFKHSNSNTKV